MDDMCVYIGNLGKYNEGEIVGDWFWFPLDMEEVEERIGLNSEYEEYIILDTDNFPCEVDEYISVDGLNLLYDIISSLPKEVVDSLETFIEYYGSLEDVYENQNDIQIYPACSSMEDVAYYYIHEFQTLGEIPSSLKHYIDYDAYGRDLELNGTFIETNYCMCEIAK